MKNYLALKKTNLIICNCIKKCAFTHVKQHVKLNKPGTQWQVLHDFAYKESRKAKQREGWWLPESGGCESWRVLVKKT